MRFIAVVFVDVLMTKGGNVIFAKGITALQTGVRSITSFRAGGVIYFGKIVVVQRSDLVILINVIAY